MRITLADDDIRKTEPTWQTHGLIERVLIGGVLLDEAELIRIWGRASRFPITLFPFDKIRDLKNPAQQEEYK